MKNLFRNGEITDTIRMAVVTLNRNGYTREQIYDVINNGISRESINNIIDERYLVDKEKMES